MPRTNYGFQQKQQKQEERFDYVRGIIAGERTRLNLTETELAEKLGMIQQTLNAKVRNPKTINLEDLYKIMDALGVTIRFERREVL